MFRHHFTPKTYLRQFHSRLRRKELWEFDLKQHQLRSGKAKDFGFRNSFYSFLTDGGGIDNVSFEAVFHSLETKFPTLLEQVRNRRELDIKQWSFLFMFVSLQKLRVPNEIEPFHRNLDSVFDFILPRWDEFKQKCTEADISFEEGRELHSKIMRATVLETFIFKTLPFLAKKFARMKWAFLCGQPPKYFITSDSPVNFWVPANSKHSLQAAGLENPQIQITFPISKSISAYGCWSDPPPSLYYNADDNLVDSLNIRQAQSTNQFLYALENDGYLAKLLQIDFKSASPRNEAP